MLSELCVRRPVFATMLVMSLVVLGLFSFRDLGVDLFPKADPATVNVSLRLPGAAPDEMTSAVIMPMENAISGIAGIDQMTANVNAGGNASISVRFVLERDLEDAPNAVREKVGIQHFQGVSVQPMIKLDGYEIILGASIDPATYTPNPADLVVWTKSTYDTFGNVTITKQVRDFATQVGPTVEVDYTDPVNGVQGLNAVTLARRGDKDARYA